MNNFDLDEKCILEQFEAWLKLNSSSDYYFRIQVDQKCFKITRDLHVWLFHAEDNLHKLIKRFNRIIIFSIIIALLFAKTLEVKAIGDLMLLIQHLLKGSLRCQMILQKRQYGMFLVSVFSYFEFAIINNLSKSVRPRICVSTKMISHSIVYRLQRIWKRTFIFFSE